MTDGFQPDWASPPGNTIADVLQARSMTVDDLAARTGLPGGFLTLLISGDAVLSEDVAVQLERVFGTPVDFWVNRERNFRRDLARQVGKIAAEVLARGLTREVVSIRAGLPAPYIEKVFARTAYYAPWVVERLQRVVSRPESEQLVPIQFPQGKVLFRDNWTEQDWANERLFRAEVDATAARRRTALLERGWKVFSQRSTERGRCAVRSWAIDPLNGARVLEEEALRTQELREPGCIEPWPERRHPLPPTTQKAIDLPERVEIKPLEHPVGLIFYAETAHGEKK